MTELVFCGQCKHRLRIECQANPEAVEDWLDRHMIRRVCSVKNARMDCPDFEPLWWIRFERWRTERARGLTIQEEPSTMTASPVAEEARPAE